MIILYSSADFEKLVHLPLLIVTHLQTYTQWLLSQYKDDSLKATGPVVFLESEADFDSVHTVFNLSKPLREQGEVYYKHLTLRQVGQQDIQLVKLDAPVNNSYCYTILIEPRHLSEVNKVLERFEPLGNYILRYKTDDEKK